MTRHVATSGKLHILYVGRIMREKGAFDMVSIGAALRDEGYENFSITMCGSGPSEAALLAAIRRQNLDSTVRFHGQCDAAGILDMYSRADVVVVPTRTDFREGFNQVVAEAILAGRPLVTSRACPAVRHLDAGVILVEPDDIDSYVAAMKLMFRNWPATNGPTLSEGTRNRFFDPEYGWIGTARRAIGIALDDDAPNSNRPQPAQKVSRWSSSLEQ